jgi:hypothetical protein
MNNPLSGVSADVAAILGHEDARDAVAGLPKAKRVQRKRDAERIKVTLDFSAAPGLEATVREAAEREGCGLSSYVLWLIKLGWERAQSESLQPRKRPARSLKHSWDVVIEGYDG